MSAIRQEGRARWPRPTTVCWLLVALCAATSGLIAVATPPWEANDEPDHVLNVETLVAGSWYRTDDPTAGIEAHQAPLYYGLLAVWQRGVLGLGPQRRPTLVNAPQPFGARVWLHDLPGDGDDQRFLTLLRLISVLCGAATVLGTAAAARALTTDQWTPAVAAAFVAGVPRFEFLSGVVNNDNLSNALGALLLLAMALVLRDRQPGERRAVAGGTVLGISVGLLVLTKVTAGLAAPAAIVALCLAASGIRQRVQALGAFVVALVLTCGWWFVQNWIRFGDPLATEATKAHVGGGNAGIFAVGSPFEQAFVKTPPVLFRSFWYTSGWNQNIWTQEWLYGSLWLVLAAALSGVVIRGRPPVEVRGAVATTTALVVGGAFAFWFLGITTTSTQARIGFFALPALGVLYALGAHRWRVPVVLRLALPAVGFLLCWLTIGRDVLLAPRFGAL